MESQTIERENSQAIKESTLKTIQEIQNLVEEITNESKELAEQAVIYGLIPIRTHAVIERNSDSAKEITDAMIKKAKAYISSD